MTDRVEKFIADLEGAIEAHGRQHDNEATTTLVIAAAQRLARVLEQLAEAGVVPHSLTVEDLRELQAELSPPAEATDLQPLIENARALLIVVEDGIVDGDAPRLRAAIARAEGLDRPAAKRSMAVSRSPRLELEDVVAKLPAGPFTVRDLSERIGRPIATTRNYLDRLVEANQAKITGEDATGRGRPTKIYERA